MSEQNQITQLRESNEDLIAYVQDYQGKVAEAQFATVQATRRAEKAEAKAAQAEEQLAEALRRVAELEPTAEPAEEAPDVPVKTPRGK